MNALVLRGVICVSPNQNNRVTDQQLYSLLGERLLGSLQGEEFRMQQVLELLPQLQVGLDVNVLFTEGYAMSSMIS